MQRRNYFKLVAVTVVCAGFAFVYWTWPPAVVIQKIGDVTFCVPRDHHLDNPGGLYVRLMTKGMPRGEGFLATVSVPLELSQPPLRAGPPSTRSPVVNIEVVPAGTYIGLLEPPQPDQHFWKILTDSTTAHEQILGSDVFLARPDYKKYGYTEYVWTSAKGRSPFAKFENGDRIVAICTIGLSCERSFLVAGYEIHYFISTQNYGAFSKFDAIIAEQVNSWHCISAQ